MTLLEKRRQGALWRAMTTDPLRKLAALALAIGLWYYLDDQRSDEQTMPLKLGTSTSQTATTDRHGLFVRLASDEYIGTFYNADDSTKLDNVTLTVRGPKERVESAMDGMLLSVDMTKVDWSTTASREFSVGDCRVERLGFGEMRLQMTPSRVRIEVERYDRKPIPISAERVNVIFESPDLKSRVLLRTAKFTPSSPRVGGPASLVKKLQEEISSGVNQKPFLARFQGSPNDLRMTVGVTLEVAGLTLLDQVNLEVEVEPQLDEFLLDVPVLPSYAALPPGVKYVPDLDGDTMQVKVLAGGELKTSLNAQEDQAQMLKDWVRKNLALVPQVQVNASDPQPELPVLAPILVVGPLHERVSPKECKLATPVAITFKLVK